MSARKLITEHLDLWTGAVTKKASSGRGSNGKVELTGVKKLRELILELAVRGKLVDQSPNDQPAQELLEKCREAKQTAVEKGRLKKARQHAPIAGHDMPFKLPHSWSWARLDDLVRVVNGRAYKKHEMLTEGAAGTPLLRVGNLFTSNDWYYSDLELEEDKYIDRGDLIYAWSASFGPFIWNGGRAIYHYHIWKLDLFDEAAIDKRFLYLYLQAVTEEIKSSGSGIAMIHMTKAKMEELVTPLPPLEEQHRIVQKVDELMALCDRLEQQTSDQLEAHETLVDTLLGTLTQSENATELADNWVRLAVHFDTLFTTEKSIDKLKQAILQLAVMGRLVEQDAEDESATMLLAKIADKKMSLFQAGIIKKPKHLPPIKKDEQYVSLPSGWVWARFGQTGYTRLGKMLDKAKNSGVEKPYLRNTNVQWWNINVEDIKTFKLESHELNEYRLESGDLLICEGGEPGRCAVWRYTNMEMYFQKAIHRHRTLDLCSPDYLKICLTVDCNSGRLSERFTGATIKHLPGDKLMTHLCPIPPLEEQHRIVQKVDELMALCDQLKGRLSQTSQTRCQLAETIVEQGLSI